MAYRETDDEPVPIFFFAKLGLCFGDFAGLDGGLCEPASSGQHRLLPRVPIADHVGKHSISARHACAQLSVPDHARVDISATPIIRYQ
jgi:hypothetical protein